MFKCGIYYFQIKQFFITLIRNAMIFKLKTIKHQIVFARFGIKQARTLLIRFRCLKTVGFPG